MKDDHPADTGRIDDLYAVLATRHRRAVLAYFRESAADVASVNDIAAEICDHDHGGEEQAVVQLQDYALPRLDAADVVDYDPRTATIRYRGHPDLDGAGDAAPDGDER